MSEHINDQPLSEQVDRLRQAQIEHASTHVSNGEDIAANIETIKERLGAIEKRLDYHDANAAQDGKPQPVRTPGDNPYQASAETNQVPSNKSYFIPDESNKAE